MPSLMNRNPPASADMQWKSSMSLSSLRQSIQPPSSRTGAATSLMIMGFAIIPITFSTGMVIDYSRAARLHTKLNAAADAAALSAVTETMMKKVNGEACDMARAMFVTQSKNVSGLIMNPRSRKQLTITVTGHRAGLPNARYANLQQYQPTHARDYKRPADE